MFISTIRKFWWLIIIGTVLTVAVVGNASAQIEQQESDLFSDDISHWYSGYETLLPGELNLKDDAGDEHQPLSKQHNTVVTQQCFPMPHSALFKYSHNNNVNEFNQPSNQTRINSQVCN